MDASEKVIERLRSLGERVTIQRRLVIEALCIQDDHITIRNISACLRARGPAGDLSEPTIYRILQWLRELGIVSQTDMGEAGVVYELVEAPHHHMICLTCGAVTTLDDSYFEPLRARLREELGFHTRIDHMAIYGYCPDCSKE
jgi:Fe2+ or Zn2+ uptake regulation protein